MNNLLGKLSLALLCSAIVLTTACSSGGSSTPAGPSNATISADNAQALATAGTEAVKQAAANSNASLFAKTVNPSPIQKTTVLLAQTASQDPALASDVSSISPSICTAGGNITGFDTIGTSGGTVNFNACDTGFGVIDGTMTITSSTSGSITTYTISANVTVSYMGDVETIKYSSTCTFNQSTGTQSCTYDSSGTGIDGRTYDVSDIEVSGDETNGYTVSATVTDPDNGVITITTTKAVKFGGCTNGQPISGAIKVSDGSNTMTVTFIDCNNYSINFNGSTTTHTW